MIFVRKESWQLYICGAVLIPDFLFILHQVPRIRLRPTLNIQVKRGQRRSRAVTSKNSYSHYNYTLGEERMLRRTRVSWFTAVCLCHDSIISPTALSCFQPSHKSLRGADRERRNKREEDGDKSLCELLTASRPLEGGWESWRGE